MATMTARSTSARLTSARFTIEELIEQSEAIHEDVLSLRSHDMVLNMIGVIRITSDDLNELIRFHSEARHRGCHVVLENVAPQLYQILRLTRLDRLFEIRT